MSEHDDEQTRADFDDAVNMTATELRKWLGHESGRHIIRILEEHEADHTDDDLAHMRKVVGYVARHTKQRPDGDVRDTPWRYSLMNWGHDPEKH